MEPGFILTCLFVLFVLFLFFIDNKEKNKLKLLEQKKKRVEDFKLDVESALQQCEFYVSQNADNKLNIDFESVNQQKQLWNVIDDAAMRLQELEDMVSLINIKEGK